MKWYEKFRIRDLALMITVVIVFLFSIFSFFYDYHTQQQYELSCIDAKLNAAAHFAQYILPDNYHDRITDASSVSDKEFTDIVSKYNDLCKKLELEYLWSLMLVDGKPVFTTATSPGKDVHANDHAAFFEEHSSPELYEEAFSTMQVQYQINDDEWGRIRAVLIPLYDSHGRKYLFGASKKMEDIMSTYRRTLSTTAFKTGLLLVMGLIATLVLGRWQTKPFIALASAAQNMQEGDLDTPLKIQGAKEIQIVSRQLESMRLAIRSHVKSLNDSIQQIEELTNIVSTSPVLVYKAKAGPTSIPVYLSENYAILGYDFEDLYSGKITWEDIVPQEDLTRIRKLFQQTVREGKDSFSAEIRFKTASGNVLWYHSWNQILTDAEGNPEFINGILTDITELKEAEKKEDLHRKQLEETRRQETKHQKQLQKTIYELRAFESVVNASPFTAFKLNVNNNFNADFVSENISVIGYNAQDFMTGKKEFASIVPAESLEKLRSRFMQALQNNEETYSMETTIRGADGIIRPYLNSYRIIRDEKGVPRFLQGLSADISEQKEAQERDLEYQSRLKKLAQQLVQAEDKERQDLAYILHDDIGQMLAGLNMKLSVLHETGMKEGSEDLFDQISQLLTRIMTTTKSLTWEISPTTLYDTDIAAGLERMASDLKIFFDLDITVETAGVRIEVDRDTSSLIFRCAKELLVNIAKHSGTHQAEVGISQYNDKVHMVVSDMGAGFDPAKLSEGKGYGLFSIRERLEQLNGSMHIDSQPGQGTKILMIVPMDIAALS